jgi:hypothetical protein
VLDHLDMIKTIMILLPILTLGLVPIVNAHSKDYWVGFEAGHDDGKNAVYDIGDTCDNYNFTRCSAGYDDGWNTTCHQGIAKFGNEDAGYCPMPSTGSNNNNTSITMTLPITVPSVGSREVIIPL